MRVFKNNNEQLLSLLEKYDDKVTELQSEINIRDLRLEELEGREKKYNLKSLEDRVQFLIDLLEKCKTQLGYISDSDSQSQQTIEKHIKNPKRGEEIFENYQKHIMVEDQDPRRKIEEMGGLGEIGHNQRNRASLDSLGKIKKEALTSN
mmetsp:Transcript_14562/g.12819  ORF Transcript_14562/g.12819 Transcript_14562/m.12819 type:complete len:149 (-) Transcript_14562:73-519(-)|eukprot:CAMPEP_0205799610 /NCGR_PEP_ID=MMETSP0205-20121125/956_1 /ASSEMBLY_ACC=CAM_ASM_000278 /TAXON_ID=36767 /ORGANISM="Euplotes focardii, Strain TN1" /LENGTH=148 /DNA_ID=CAMNT_0053061245 /DNA_START=329 /DNA_END=775 /DNA_ORIENTATION=-